MKECFFSTFPIWPENIVEAVQMKHEVAAFSSSGRIELKHFTAKSNQIGWLGPASWLPFGQSEWPVLFGCIG